MPFRPRRFLRAALALALGIPFFTTPSLADRRAVPPSFVGAAQAARPEDAKLEPALRLVVERAEALKAKGLQVSSAPRFRTLAGPGSPLSVLLDPDGAEPDVLAFVQLRSPDAAPALEVGGTRVLSQVDEIAVVRAPISRVREIAALEDVLQLEISKQSYAALDSSRKRSGVTSVHAGTGGVPRAFDGTGVVVGVLDSGIDYRHADFRTAGNASRLQGLFDYGTGANGIECRLTQLGPDSLNCPEKDGTGGFGHGTHVTGIAAGGGRRNSSYIGMAPGADIVFVKGIRHPESLGGFADADVLAGAQFVFQKARALGKPCVLNLSLGGQLGAHDGTSLQEQALSRLSRPGNIIVAAAGNSGSSTIHCSYPVEGTDYNTSLETAWGVFNGAAISIVDLWYPAGTSVSVGIAAYSGSDFNTPVFVSNFAVAPGQLIQSPITTLGGSTLANATIDARTTADPNNGARRVLIALEDANVGFELSDVVWSLWTIGSGTIDMWVGSGGEFAPTSLPLPSYFRFGDDAKTIGTPATARRVLAIGSHVTKTQWVDFNGVTRIQGGGATLDAISGFSSRGPSRDGRVLPDLTAPGEAILSSLSQDFPAVPAEVLQGGGLLKQQGTSQAAPHVTGVIALMLERNRFLTPENARAILQQTATPAGGGVPNNVFGAGRLNALAAVLATPDPVPCNGPGPLRANEDCEESLAPEGPSLEIRPNPAAAFASVTFRLPAAEPVHLAVYDLLGRRVNVLRDAPTAAGPHALRWEGRDERGVPVPSGVYLVRLLTPTRSAVQRMVVVK